jgi:allantoicase
MFDGFESARSRRPGHHEELEILLGKPIRIGSIHFDFTHFVNNNPKAIRILGEVEGNWREIAPFKNVKIFAANHCLVLIEEEALIQKLKFEIYPDGGINRIHVYPGDSLGCIELS